MLAAESEPGEPRPRLAELSAVISDMAASVEAGMWFWPKTEQLLLSWACCGGEARRIHKQGLTSLECDEMKRNHKRSTNEVARAEAGLSCLQASEYSPRNRNKNKIKNSKRVVSPEGECAEWVAAKARAAASRSKRRNEKQDRKNHNVWTAGHAASKERDRARAGSDQHIVPRRVLRGEWPQSQRPSGPRIGLQR